MRARRSGLNRWGCCPQGLPHCIVCLPWRRTPARRSCRSMMIRTCRYKKEPWCQTTSPRPLTRPVILGHDNGRIIARTSHFPSCPPPLVWISPSRLQMAEGRTCSDDGSSGVMQTNSLSGGSSAATSRASVVCFLPFPVLFLVTKRSAAEFTLWPPATLEFRKMFRTTLLCGSSEYFLLFRKKSICVCVCVCVCDRFICA